MKDYDLILVVGYFRSATSFLSVIKALGQQMRIAVLPVEADPAMRSKTGDAQAVFFDLCQQFGAELLNLGEPARAAMLVVQQFPYGDGLAEAIQKNLTVQHRVGLMTLAMSGLEVHDAFLSQFGIHKVYVPSRRFMEFLLERRSARKRYQGVEIEEVGLPFAKYPVFPGFSADWLIAAPTLFSFHNETGKQRFLQTVIQLLRKIPPDDRVVYKSHNGNSLDYFAPRLHYRLAGWLDRVPRAQRLLQFARGLPWSWLRMQLNRLDTCLLHRAVLKRAMPMAAVTPYAEMSMEAFLPGVRKGVVGGLSNTIWGTAYFDLPFYNCVDETDRQGHSELLDKRSDALLDLNLQYFGVPFCNGELEGDSRKLNIVRPSEREGDLITAIVDDLALTRNAHGIVV